MTMQEFVEKYGTKTASMTIREFGAHLSPANYQLVEELAKDLEEALYDFTQRICD